MRTKVCFPIGVSLTKEIVEKIDSQRHDIPRSKYILRLIEVCLQQQQESQQEQVLAAGGQKDVQQ
jgi:metal-responsive CopG/Arc/MetJ family transcriptional regulator